MGRSKHCKKRQKQRSVSNNEICSIKKNGKIIRECSETGTKVFKKKNLYLVTSDCETVDITTYRSGEIESSIKLKNVVDLGEYKKGLEAKNKLEIEAIRETRLMEREVDRKTKHQSFEEEEEYSYEQYLALLKKAS